MVARAPSGPWGHQLIAAAFPQGVPHLFAPAVPPLPQAQGLGFSTPFLQAGLKCTPAIASSGLGAGTLCPP